MNHTVTLLTTLWINGGGDKPKKRTWTLPRSCSEFQTKFDSIQAQLEDLCGMDELLTGVISKSKGQILRVAAIFNALFSLDDDHPLDENLSNVAIKAVINFVEMCNEHTAIIGGRKSTVEPLKCMLSYCWLSWIIGLLKVVRFSD